MKTNIMQEPCLQIKNQSLKNSCLENQTSESILETYIAELEKSRKSSGSALKKPSQHKRCISSYIVKRNLNEELSKKIQNEEIPIKYSELDRKKELMKDAINQIDVLTIQNFITIESPPQSVVNILIAFVSLLQRVKPSSCVEHLEFKAMLQKTEKTYKNCLFVLRKLQVVHDITHSLFQYAETANEKEMKEILKIKHKYLAGWDMKPAGFSDANYSSRAILLMILRVFDYFEVRAI